MIPNEEKTIPRAWIKFEDAYPAHDQWVMVLADYKDMIPDFTGLVMFTGQWDDDPADEHPCVKIDGIAQELPKLVFWSPLDGPPPLIHTAFAKQQARIAELESEITRLRGEAEGAMIDIHLRLMERKNPDGTFSRIDFSEAKTGDVIRLTEDDGKPVFYMGTDIREMILLGEPKPCNPPGNYEFPCKSVSETE